MSEREKMAARNSNFCYLLNALYPVGSIYVSKDPTDPAELFGGSWKRIKERFIWAIGDNENPGDTGGEKTHTLTEAELPKLSGSISNFALQEQGQSVSTSGVFSTRASQEWATYGSNGKIQDSDIVDFSAGRGQAHNNMPPWEGFYIWERIESDVPMGGSAGMLLADQTYNPESANAQSGIAVAQAVDTCSPAIVTASDTGKTLSIPDSSESVIKGLTAYGESTQDGTPTTDSPVEIASVENPVISVCGKNLCPTPNADFSFSQVTYYDLLLENLKVIDIQGVTLTLSVKQGYDDLQIGFGAGGETTDGTGYWFQYPAKGARTFTFIIPENYFTAPQTVTPRIRFYRSAGVSVQEYSISEIQLEIGSVATPYQPYIEPQTLTIPYTFRGLKNSSGEWTARDELRVGDGKVEIVQRINQELAISGVKTVAAWIYENTNLGYYIVNFTSAPGERYPTMSNYFKTGYSGTSSANGSVTVERNGTLYFRMQDGYLEDERFDTPEHFTEWLSANKVSIVYVMANSIVTDITSTEAGQALLALKTNYPNTSVISDIDLNITYKADTKNYIDKRIAALTALTLEG